MSEPAPQRYVSRGGEKLAAAFRRFSIDPAGMVCADLGSHVGGFVDCLLRFGASRVYSVDTSYGTLAWTLRCDSRVVVLERTNAMHVSIPEPVELITIDVGWTPQSKVLPNAAALLRESGRVITLIKPHYERQAARTSPARTRETDTADGGRGETVLSDRVSREVVNRVLGDMAVGGWEVLDTLESPLRGHGGNREFLALLQRGRGTGGGVDRVNPGQE